MPWEALEAKWVTPGPWEVQAEVAVVALNQKVLDKFLKVYIEGEGARQGARPQRPVSPLLLREVEHSVPLFLCQKAENMICVEDGDLLPFTARASSIGYLTAS